jgi:hypothetical protein
MKKNLLFAILFSSIFLFDMYRSKGNSFHGNLMAGGALIEGVERPPCGGAWCWCLVVVAGVKILLAVSFCLEADEAESLAMGLHFLLYRPGTKMGSTDGWAPAQQFHYDGILICHFSRCSQFCLVIVKLTPFIWA